MLDQDHTLIRIKKKVDFSSFFLRQVMRNLHPDHSSIYVDKKVEKVPQVCLVGDGTFEQVLLTLRRFSKYFHILRTYRCIDSFPWCCALYAGRLAEHFFH